MVTISIDDAMHAICSPIHTTARRRLALMWADRGRLLPREITELDVSVSDRIRILTAVLSKRDPDSLEAFADACAERAAPPKTAGAKYNALNAREWRGYPQAFRCATSAAELSITAEDPVEQQASADIVLEDLVRRLEACDNRETA